MSWINLKTTSAALVALTVATAATAAAAEPLVVRSQGPSSRAYPPGKALTSNARITLRQNDVVVVLDGAGTRTLRGPGTFSASASSGVRTAANVLGNGENPRVRLGTTRSVTGARAVTPRSPNVWLVDTTRSSTVCVSSDHDVTLWRPTTVSSTADTTTIARSAGGKTESVNWVRGATLAPWPSALPVANGAEYQLRSANGAGATTIRFTLLNSDPTGLEDLAQVLIRQGCGAQLDMLIDSVSLPERVPPAG